MRLGWRGGVITERTVVRDGTGEECWLAPSLVDLQVNGYAGVDFQRDDVQVEDLRRANRGLQTAGCGRWLLTVTTDHWERMLGRLERYRRMRESSAELRKSIAGWHVEGPFLSHEPGYHGAHDPGLMLDPSPERILALRAVTGTDPVLLTLAPEREGGIESIRLAVSTGMRVSLGHTNVSADRLGEAVRAGARGFTHLGNGCPQELDRHDNILWRVLDNGMLDVSLIADGIHVSGALFRVVHRVLGGERLYYTTDAMSAAGMPPGRYTIGALEVDVGEDQVVWQPGRTNYAGSALRPIDGVIRAAQMLGCSWRETWTGFSDRPARFMGWKRGLECGDSADFCLVQIERDGTLRNLRLFGAGQEVV